MSASPFPYHGDETTVVAQIVATPSHHHVLSEVT
jgi:hypothetical protein